MTAAQPPASDHRPLLRRPVFWIVAVVVVALAALVVAAGMMLAGDAASTDAAGATERPVPTQTTAPTPVPSVTAEPAASGPSIPADCAGIYTKDWAPEMDGLVLNPAWTDDPASGVRYGSNDTGLVTVLEATTKVTCVWANATGGSDAGGLTTNVAALTPEQSTDVLAHMEELGYDCYEELAGTRCVTETFNDNGTIGESHFVREGIWVATWWLNVGPDGYTHDVVTAIFGA
jgi:hypothetical protein